MAYLYFLFHFVRKDKQQLTFYNITIKKYSTFSSTILVYFLISSCVKMEQLMYIVYFFYLQLWNSKQQFMISKSQYWLEVQCSNKLQCVNPTLLWCAFVCCGVKTSIPECISVLKATFNIRTKCNHAINWNNRNNFEKGNYSNATEQLQCKPVHWYVYTTINNNIKIKMSSMV